MRRPSALVGGEAVCRSRHQKAAIVGAEIERGVAAMPRAPALHSLLAPGGRCPWASVPERRQGGTQKPGKSGHVDREHSTGPGWEGSRSGCRARDERPPGLRAASLIRR